MSTITAFDFLNQPEKELYRFLKEKLPKEQFNDLKEKLNQQLSLESFVRNIIDFDNNPNCYNVNSRNFPRSLRGENRTF